MKFGFTKEIKIALLTIVTGSMLYTGFNFLKGNEAFSKNNYYKVFFKNVDGLVQGNPVYVNGMNVGQVKELDLMPDNQIKVVLQVQGKIKLTDSTNAKLVDGSLLGGKEIILDVKSGTKILKDGATIPSHLEASIGDALMNEAKPILKGVDITLANLNGVLNATNQKNISKMLSNLETVSEHMKNIMTDNKLSLATTTDNLSKLTSALVETEKQLKPILANLESFSDSLKDARFKSTVVQATKTIADLDETINKVNKGKGSISKLMNEDSLYVHLDKTVKDLDLLFVDIKAHPKRYAHFSVFGDKKDK